MAEESSSPSVAAKASDRTIANASAAMSSDERYAQDSCGEALSQAAATRRHHHEEAQMREDDDTILEVGIGHSTTPVLKPLRPPPSGPPPVDIAEGDTGVEAVPFPPMRSSSGGGGGGHPVVRLSCGKIVRTFHSSLEGCQVALRPATETSGVQPAQACYRRCLSGDDAAVATFGSIDFDSSSVLPPPANDGKGGSVVDETVTLQLGHIDAPSLLGSLSGSVAGKGSFLVRSSEVTCLPLDGSREEDNEVGMGQRSKSIARLLNEAAQFAEAVGEVPPFSEDGIVIQDDRSSDDDDDDDEGTVVDVNEAVDALPPTKTVSTPYRKEASVSIRNDGPLSNAERTAFEEEGGGKSRANAQRSERSCASAPLPNNTAASRREEAEPSEDTAASSGRDRKIARDARFANAKRPWLGKRFDWPPRSQSAGNHHLTLLRYVPDGGDGAGFPGSSGSGFFRSCPQFAYRGIHANPPEITKRGISRGNYAQLHRKAWLEVSDKYHRYGKNLRLYYKHWESLGHPTNMFFDWLDSKGEAAGQALPNLPGCPRSELDSDTVLYITNPEVQESYALDIVSGRDANGSEPRFLVDSDGDPVRTGPEGWIFVLRDHVLYGAPKVTSISGKSKQRFHHSSFFGGKAVAAAGILITDDCGRLTRLYPHSGHYRPGEADMQRMLFFLQHGGVDLTAFEVDLQQILHVSRTVKDANTPKGGSVVDEADRGGKGAGKKAKKVDSLHLKPALYVACLLAHKARMIGEGVFSQVHKIRAIGAVSVREALCGIDEGGYWEQLREQL